MDAITLLKDDHQTVEKLFKRFEKAGDGAHKERADVAAKIREELSRHAAPKVREALGRKDLGQLGDAMEQARRIAPTHPHPRSPDTPPGNIAVGAAAAVADRIGDGVKDAAQGAVSTAQDVISRIVGGRGESSRNNGTPAKAAKQTASKASTNGRKAAGTAKKATTSTAKRAGSTAKKTAASSTSTAKRAGGAAKKATTSTAKRAGSTAKKTAGTARTTARKTASTAKTTAKRSAAARR